MVRRFDPSVPVEMEVVRGLVTLAVRAPSAGFSQGWDFVALLNPQDRGLLGRCRRRGRPMRGYAGCPPLPPQVLCLSDAGAYLDRTRAGGQGWVDRSPDRWPIPYWDTDTAMAAMIILLGAQDRRAGREQLGIPGQRHDAVREAHGIPRTGAWSGSSPWKSTPAARAARTPAGHRARGHVAPWRTCCTRDGSAGGPARRRERPLTDG